MSRGNKGFGDFLAADLDAPDAEVEKVKPADSIMASRTDALARIASGKVVTDRTEFVDPARLAAPHALRASTRGLFLEILIIEIARQDLVQPLADRHPGTMRCLDGLFPDVGINSPNAPRQCIRHFRTRFPSPRFSRPPLVWRCGAESRHVESALSRYRGAFPRYGKHGVNPPAFFDRGER